MKKLLALVPFCLFIFYSLEGFAQTVVEPPTFSVKHGFYTQIFDLQITSQIAGAVIKLTLDCSDPQTSPTAITQNSPHTIRIDPETTIGNKPKSPCVIVRACVKTSDNLLSKTETHTYIFIDKINTLSPQGQKPAANWPTATTSSTPQMIDYGMDPDVYNDPRYKSVLRDAMLAIPSISIATNIEHFFSTATGIYMNALKSGSDWERPTSVELINPDGSTGFQVNAGIRIRGGWSSHGDNPKHAFRLFFRSDYGDSKLRYPLFGDEGTDEFDKIDLRTAQNYAWSYPGHMGEYNTFISEVFSRDVQGKMGQPYTRSRHYHLYLNGVYWGLYQTQERAEENFAESYLGGNEEDYDVIKPDDNKQIEATSGNLTAYTALWNSCKVGYISYGEYFKVQGLNVDGTPNNSYKKLVDIDNLIDYMLTIFYTGNYDAPVSKFGSDNMINNFFAIYNRNSNEGFKFFQHDAEHSLRTTAGEGPGIGLYENRVNIKMNITSLSSFNPQWLHYRLSSNSEYRMKFADRVYKHFFNDGILTTPKTTALFKARAKEIELAIIGESARWGDTYFSPARTKDDHWQPAIDDIVKNYFSFRPGVVLSQLLNANLYSSINPPVFEIANQNITGTKILVAIGDKIKLSNPHKPDGTIIYTTDGIDPRAIGGTPSVSSIDGGDDFELTVTQPIILKARVFNGTNWSALHEVSLNMNADLKNLKVTEIHYHPLDNGSIDDGEYEFLELKNISNTTLDLSGSKFPSGIDYTFPMGTKIEPNSFIVLASNKSEFKVRYSIEPFAEYGGQLDNSGEKLVLLSATNDTVFSVKYDDASPWVTTPDGGGYSLVTKEANPFGDLNDAANWRASYSMNGSPGKDDLNSTKIKQTQSTIPVKFLLNQNFPNPFNPTTIISYRLPHVSNVLIVVYDLLGRVVKTLVNEEKQPGNYFVEWNTDEDLISSGIYFYQLRAGNPSAGSGQGFVETKKMMLVR
ncbi:MAG: CotH kinase family protein [Melioribacteraceae bacterium]